VTFFREALDPQRERERRDHKAAEVAGDSCAVLALVQKTRKPPGWAGRFSLDISSSSTFRYKHLCYTQDFSKCAINC
jgi:hypothetical protein